MGTGFGFASHGVPALSLFTICLDNEKTIDCSVKPFSLARLSSLRKEGKSASWISFSLGIAVRFAFAGAHFIPRSPGFTRPEIRSWIIGSSKVLALRFDLLCKSHSVKLFHRSAFPHFIRSA